MGCGRGNPHRARIELGLLAAVGKRDVGDLSIPLAQRMWFAADLRSNPCQVNPIRPINSVSEAVVSLSGRSTAELGASPEHIDELNRRSVI